MIATGLVVLVGAATWIGGSSREGPSAAATAEHPQGPVASSGAAGASRTSPSAPLATAIVPARLRVSAVALTRLLDAALAPPRPISEHDPFATFPMLSAHSATQDVGTARAPREPSIPLEGIFHSLLVRGALIGGKVIFEGEPIDAQTTLARVHLDHVEIVRRGAVSTVPYEPQFRSRDEDRRR